MSLLPFLWPDVSTADGRAHAIRVGRLGALTAAALAAGAWLYELAVSLPITSPRVEFIFGFSAIATMVLVAVALAAASGLPRGRWLATAALIALLGLELVPAIATHNLPWPKALTQPLLIVALLHGVRGALATRTNRRPATS